MTGLRATLLLARAVATKQLTIMTRYPVNTLAEFGVTLLFFFLIFFGGRTVGGPAFSDRLDGFLVGYFVWTMASRAYSGIAGSISTEAAWGTLEQLYISPYGFGTVMGLNVVVDVLISLLWGGLALGIMLLVTGRPITIDPFTIAPLVVLTLLPAVGIGFAFGGLALVYKRIDNLFPLVRFGLFGLVTAPLLQQKLLRFLPLTQGSELLGQAMRDGVSITEMSPIALGFLLGTAVVYFFPGYLIFSRLSERARRKGMLGQY
jgi:ABC-2 type transport system permease protein